MLRSLNRAMCALFLLACVVQVNDPDPARWIAIYGAALVVCLIVAVRGRIPGAAPLLVAGVAVAWSLAIALGGPAAAVYAHMFDAWEMRSAPVEEAREASGLLIVAAWMIALAFAKSTRAAG
jgi:hypothetical protein